MFFPPCLPDELIFSRLIRHCILTGMEGHDYMNNYFGSTRKSIHPYLTSNFIGLKNISEERPIDIIKEQTLIPLFTYFLPRYSSKIIEAAISGNTANVCRHCQLPSFRGREKLQLYSCDQCIITDIRRYGVSYWHKSHHIPGCKVCSEHGVYLNESILPERLIVEPNLLPKLLKKSHKARNNEIILSNYSHKFIENIAEHENNLFGSYYIDILSNFGYTTRTGRVRIKKLMKDFSSFYNELDTTCRLLLPKSLSDYNYIHSLLRDDNNQHPFKHLVFSCWILEILSSSENNYNCTTSITNNIPVLNEATDTSFHIKTLNNSSSISEASRITGKSRCYLRRLASLNKIEFATQSTFTNKYDKSKIIHLAYSGVKREHIAISTGASLGYVDYVISCELGLVERRKLCRKESKRRRCRLQILRYMRKNPLSKLCEIKSNCCASYYWLFNNDKRWLNINKPKTA